MIIYFKNNFLNVLFTEFSKRLYPYLGMNVRMNVQCTYY